MLCSMCLYVHLVFMPFYICTYIYGCCHNCNYLLRVEEENLENNFENNEKDNTTNDTEEMSIDEVIKINILI